MKRVQEGVAALLFMTLLACGVSASLYADPTELFRAVKNNDVASVKVLIKAGENVNGKADDPQHGVSQATPLYYAINNGNLEVVRMLLDAGSDPNATPFLEGPGALGYHDALVVFAAQDRRWDIVDMLLAKGAQEKDLDDYLHVTLERDVGTGGSKDLTDAEEIIKHVKRLHIPLFYWAFQFESGGPEVREFISKHVPEISQGKTSLLGALLDLGEKDVALFGTSGKIPFPLATSSLQDPKNPGRYDAARAFDGDLNTSWVEGAAGDGIGEKIAFRIPRSAKTVAVFPGYGVSKYFSANNRVKTAVLSLYSVGVARYENAAGYSCRKLSDVELTFSDSAVFQKSSLGTLPNGLDDSHFVIGVLEIRSVYPGAKYQDTCVAEIKLE
jgi:hypothetical protein